MLHRMLLVSSATNLFSPSSSIINVNSAVIIIIFSLINIIVPTKKHGIRIRYATEVSNNSTIVMALHSVPQAVLRVIIEIEWTDIFLKNHVELHNLFTAIFILPIPSQTRRATVLEVSLPKYHCKIESMRLPCDETHVSSPTIAYMENKMNVLRYTTFTAFDSVEVKQR
ncbi:hypothetical protein EAF00_007436 [Botryotinia globosa]|nr:hypothetical protein EAF00_007436 [Botryotinia globosa]